MRTRWEGVKKSENFADVINGSSLCGPARESVKLRAIDQVVMSLFPWVDCDPDAVRPRTKTAILCGPSAFLLHRLVIRGLRELPDMTSAKFSDFLALPPCPHLDLIYALKFMQPPFYIRFSMTPLPPLMWTSYVEAP